MAIIGILFDIDALEEVSYGKAAYEILFNSVEHQKIRNVRLFDGDTAATLHLPGAVGETRRYCIALESDNDEMIGYVEGRLAASQAKGLCPLDRRFRRDAAALKAEPLVYAGTIDVRGVLIDSETPWVMSVWPGQVKRAYDLVLKEAGSDKYAVIKEVRATIDGIGLGEAKALVEGVPKTIKVGVTRREAREIWRKFKDIGAKVEIR